MQQDNNLIGITEGADPTVNFKWSKWVVEDQKPAILITKNPSKLLPLITENDNIIVHCSITGLGGSIVEPNIEKLDTSLNAYHEFCKLLTPERVVLRIDPIVYWERDKNLLKHIASESEGRLRISFVDIYAHVIGRFKENNTKLPFKTGFNMPLDLRKHIWEELGKPELCGEPDMTSTPCVSEFDCSILGVEPINKRKGQRLACSCLANKIELCTRPPKCTYDCLYCYWK